MNKKQVYANILLLITAVIWGFSFVAQRTGMEHMKPFSFNGVRFLLGSVTLVPLLFILKQRPRFDIKTQWFGCVCAGSVLFCASSLQQIGIIGTTAGKAGFITGLYIVLVPIGAFIFRHTISSKVWIGSLLGVIGLYFLCINETMRVEKGDFLVFCSTFFWSSHILVIDHFSKKIDPIILAISQFAVCGFLSMCIAFFISPPTIPQIQQTLLPLLYSSFLTIGTAFTLQIIAQRHAQPAQAAIIMSMEAPFAVAGGFMFLKELLTVSQISGCVLMLSGMIISQLPRNTTK